MFAKHGTKIIGAVGAVAGTVAMMTPDQLTAVFGSNAPSVALTVMSLLTVLRGFQNSGQIPGGPTKKE